MAWYAGSFRRMLCDMHISDWDPRFLPRFDPEEYVRLLCMARVQTVMLYYQAHTGLCYFPTHSARMHRAFQGREDAMIRTETLCHEAGMSVVGYYSLIFNNWAEETHPEWAMVLADGGTPLQKGMSRYGHCCPNQRGYRAFVSRQLREMLDCFSPEGMFFDMPFWPLPCSCAACRERWEREAGKAWPRDPRDAEMLAARRRWMEGFVRSVAEECRSLRPGISVEFNCAHGALPSMEKGISDGLCRAGDYAGGDLYRTFRTQSFACKLFRGLSRMQPFEYMTGRCVPDLHNHTMTKTRDQLTLAVMLTLAHHGANLLIDAMDPEGTLDSRVYERIGEVYGKAMAYEPFLTGELRAEVGVCFSQECKEWPSPIGTNHYTGALGAAETLQRAHIGYGVIRGGAPLEEMKRYRALIFSQPDGLSPEVCQNLEGYVRQGGALYFSGAGAPELLRRLTGGVYRDMSPGKYAYLRPRREGVLWMPDYTDWYPLPIPRSLPLVEGIPRETVTAEITLPYPAEGPGRFASIHSDPPGRPTEFPGMAALSVGKGRVLWSAAPVECFPEPDCRRLLLAALDSALPEPMERMSGDAPSRVELIAFDAPERRRIFVSAVDLNDEAQAEVQQPFTVTLRTGAPVGQVCLLPEGEPVAFARQGDEVRFSVRDLRICAQYALEW